MDKIDYTKYSVEELEDAYRHIDRDRWPDRVKEIELILNDPVKRRAQVNTDKYRKKIKEERAQKSRKRREPLGYALMYIVLGVLVSFFGLLASRTGQGTTVDSMGERVLIGIVFFAIAYLYFNKWRKSAGKRRHK
ncbi:DUF3169 family protein [Shewanella halotolerans]|uniref:DUF3169 family protein n=1 Tax=Shewanella halotolerans TaxID=2864204 RepID=UPI001C660CBB|nr:DUF3169 family protein [Shewanella halotolerans]QYJ91145.1 DUF3169 family protein [Shewanella halotolerans]